MEQYRISLDVVRKANARMGQIQQEHKMYDCASNGEIVIHLNTLTLSKTYTLTLEEINEAYRKAVESVRRRKI